jgi:hypothetical protein
MLDGFGHRGVDDAANVAAVDAHAERHGRDHDVQLFFRKRILYLRALFLLHARVIMGRLDSIELQQFGRVFGVLAADAIDDDRSPL